MANSSVLISVSVHRKMPTENELNKACCIDDDLFERCADRLPTSRSEYKQSKTEQNRAFYKAISKYKYNLIYKGKQARENKPTGFLRSVFN